MLEEQGFDVSPVNQFNLSEVNSMKAANQLDMIVQQSPSTESNTEEVLPLRKTYVHYHIAKGLKKANLEDIVTDLFHVEQVLSKKDTLVIVVKEEVNETLINALMLMWERDHILVILYSLARLQFNVLKHSLVPKHVVLTEAQAQEVREKYNIVHDDQFPPLSRFDPAAQAIGIRPGQVCEIWRPSKTAVVAKYYRLCANIPT